MEKNYLQAHGTALGTKMAVAFANIFMAKVETDILSQSVMKSLKQKRCSWILTYTKAKDKKSRSTSCKHAFQAH